MMKRITTPKLLWVLVVSLVLAYGLDFLVPAPPAKTPLAIPVLGVTLLLTALAACAILAWRLMKRVGVQKGILICGAVVFVLCGLFPPWLYTYDVTGTHSRSDAGYYFVLTPPGPKPSYGNSTGIQLDTSRLLIEWACILAATGAGWVIFIPRKPAKEQRKEANDPLALN